LFDENKITNLKEVFKSERTVWSERVKTMTKMLKYPEKLVILQMDLYAAVMDIAENRIKISEALVEINKIVRSKRSESLVYHKTESDLKLNNVNEYNIMMNSDLNQYIERQELLNMQYDYLDIVYKNLKDMLYGVRNYIELQKVGY